MVINWPEIKTQSFDLATFSRKEKPYSEAKKEYEKQLDQLADWIEPGAALRSGAAQTGGASFERDVKLEAMVPVVRGDMPILVFADRRATSATRWSSATSRKSEMILAGGTEAWKNKGPASFQGCAVILRPTLGEPRRRG